MNALRFVPLLLVLTAVAHAQPKTIPAPLQPWESWATWNDDALRLSPTVYSDAKKPLTFWPSELRISANSTGASLRQSVTVYRDSWVGLPGDTTHWPADVKVNGQPTAVLPNQGTPAVRLPAGTHEITANLPWKSLPQFIQIPGETGIVALEVDGAAIEFPLWDAAGRLWLRRDASPEEAAGPDSLTTNLYALLEDGIPLWLHVRAELIVSGQSREEDLGVIVPQGWKIASVNSPLPVAVEKNGQAKAQVRAGKWIVDLSAFRLDDAREINFPPKVRAASAAMLLGFRAKPDFRVLEITGAAPIDVTMTTFPEDWRNVPVYRWTLEEGPLTLDERLRGMGQRTAEGLTVSRSLWIDDDGRAFTFRDNLSGNAQELWRLDAANGQQLGSVRANGEGQLITINPANGSVGVEIRQRNLALEATGRMDAQRHLPATGWQTDADKLDMTLNLPPGWRLFALFGADWVQGDWLTGWSLLDIFIVLIFSLAVLKLWGTGPALLACLALVLSYREPAAPQLLWLALLAPVAILPFVPVGKLRAVTIVWKWLTVAIFIFTLVPFLSAQIQQAIFPQLENHGHPLPAQAPAPMAMPASSTDGKSQELMESSALMADSYDIARVAKFSFSASRGRAQQPSLNSNLVQVANARIQTGPGVPEWTWRTARFGWNGPVTSDQTFHPVFVSATVERLLTILRLAAVVALFLLLLGRRTPRLPSTLAAVVLTALMLPSPAQAQFPEKAMINVLRERLLDQSQLPPQTAEIPSASLQIEDRRFTVNAEIHTATLAAVPLPGRFPAWSPVRVTVDGKPSAALRRADGYLWVALTTGVHQVRAEGLLSDAAEWEWTFLLKPRRISVQAPGWNIGGISPEGVPEQQVFFSKQQKSGESIAAYDRQDLQTVALVEREIEAGLVRQARTTVRRLTASGKAISLKIPLLPGEKVLSGNLPINNGQAEVRIPAGLDSVSWQSELDDSSVINLTTSAEDTWVEQWRLLASPVWNFQLEGLAPIFAGDTSDLVPVWRPWPGESATVFISPLEPVPGATVTVHRVTRQETLGDRQRNSSMSLALTTSLGGDFALNLPPEAQVTSLKLAGQDIPVRADQGQLVVPLRTGTQDLAVEWKTPSALGTRAVVEAVRLPVESANIETQLLVPDNRWVLWTHGPQRGPAVRFWIVLTFALLAAAVLARLPHSPLRTVEWALLGLGLTQVSLPEALFVVGWLFLLAWRSTDNFRQLKNGAFNLAQLAIIAATFIALVILIHAVGAGLLGSPEMFIEGNNSTRGFLRWYQARSGESLPEPWILSVSIWWYRLAMLLWALWLAAATLRWLVRGWKAFVTGGTFRSSGKKSTPPPVPENR